MAVADASAAVRAGQRYTEADSQFVLMLLPLTPQHGPHQDSCSVTLLRNSCLRLFHRKTLSPAFRRSLLLVVPTYWLASLPLLSGA